MSAKVLVVEDEAPLAEILRYNLESEGFRVAHAESGEETPDEDAVEAEDDGQAAVAMSDEAEQAG